MTTMGKLVAAMFVALMLGFGAGELLGPKAAVAVAESCPQQICYLYPGPPHEYYQCNAAATDSWCEWTGFGNEICRTRDCGELCDPEVPDCEGPPD